MAGYEVRTANGIHRFRGANSVEIKDGYLYLYEEVSDSASKVLAIFAARQWVLVEPGDDK